MSIFKKINSLFSVTDEEVKSFRLLFLQSLFIGFANSYYYIVSSSLLIRNVNIKRLPTAYIITGIGGFILIKLYKTLQKKHGITGSFKVSLIIFSLICFANFYAVSAFGNDKTLQVYLAYFIVLFAAPFTTIFSLGVFSQCSRLYNISQSKRLLALIVSGEIIASVIAYMSVPFLRGLINGNVSVLLPVSGLIILLVFVPFNRLLAAYKNKLNIPVAAKEAQKMDISFFTKDKFYLLIAVTTIFSVFAIYVIDYAYLVSVRYMSAQSGLEVAEIVSVFFFIVKIGELTFSFLSGNILSNKGIRYSLLLLPLFLLFASSLAFVSGFVFASIPVFLLSFLFLAKLTERAIRKSITTPSVKVLYQVAEPNERQEIEANIDGLLNQVATIVSGVLLLVISVFFFGDDPFRLLQLFSFVCILAFALWSFFSARMYDSYRVKIKDFLSRLKSESHPGSARSVQHAAIQDGDNSAYDVAGITKTIALLQHATRDELIALVKVYNTKQSLDTATEGEEKIAKKLINIYYSNHFYFSRLLIIKYLPYCSENMSFTFLQELWEVSDLVGKLELILSFNEKTHHNIDVSYFERLCEECASDITWAESCLHDTAVLKDEQLEKQLKEHNSALIRVLFELLKAIYEPSVIQVIYDIITRENAELENQFFALELLDITLRPGLKEIVKHLLEPTTFENKKQVLEKTFHIYFLSPEERLIDIMMKDYNLVSPALKETALVLYNNITDKKDVLSAFRSSSIDNLRYKSEEIFSGVADPLSLARMTILAKLESSFDIAPYSSSIFNNALFTPGPNKMQLSKHVVKNNLPSGYTVEWRTDANVPVKVDTLAVALLATLKQNNKN